MFYMRYPLLFLSIFIFGSRAFGMEEQTDLDLMRGLSIDDVILNLHNLKNNDDYFNKRTHDPVRSKKIKDDPTDYDKYLNAGNAIWIDNYCQVAAEKLQVKSKLLEYFNYAYQQGYFQNSEINKKIADHIPITKDDLSEHDFNSALTLKEKIELIDKKQKANVMAAHRKNEYTNMLNKTQEADRQKELEKLNAQHAQDLEEVKKKQQKFEQMKIDREKEHQQIKKEQDQVGADTKKEFKVLADEIEENFTEMKKAINNFNTGGTYDPLKLKKKKEEPPATGTTKAKIMCIIVSLTAVLFVSALLYSIVMNTA